MTTKLDKIFNDARKELEEKMDNLVFEDANQIYTVIVYKDIYEQMLYYCDRANTFETGGILIGNYSFCQTTANIFQITPPPKNSRHGKSNFLRSSTGLKKVLNNVWNQGQYYLGEWHYHPKSSSFPSNVDKNQMMSFSKNQALKCPEPILIVIGGSKNNWNINVSIYSNHEQIILNRTNIK